MLADKGSAEQTVVLPGGMNGIPPPILGARFRLELLSSATFHFQNLMKINNLQGLKGQCRFYKGIREVRHIGSRGPNLDLRVAPQN